MIRTWLSSFFKRNKSKILVIIKYFAMIVLVATVCAIFFSNMINKEIAEEDKDELEVYKPTKTVISGTNIEEEEFEEEDNLIKTFVEYCNNGEFEQAYNLLTDECREKQFPTFSKFKEKYCDVIFATAKTYNMQSWVNKSNCNTYKVRFTEDFLSTGNYDEAQKYEDYITIIEDSQTKEKKLNINSYVKTKEINKTTSLDNLEIVAIEEDIYMEYVTYEIKVTNKGNYPILLDDLKSTDNIKLIGSNEATYRLNKTNLKVIQLQINENSVKNISLTFNKQYGSEVDGTKIQFKAFIDNYNEYKNNVEEYSEYENIEINI